MKRSEESLSREALNTAINEYYNKRASHSPKPLPSASSVPRSQLDAHDYSKTSANQQHNTAITIYDQQDSQESGTHRNSSVTNIMNLFNNEQASAHKGQEHSPPPHSTSNGPPLSENRGAESKGKESLRTAAQAGGKPANEKFKDDDYVIRPRVLRKGKESNQKQKVTKQLQENVAT